MRKTLKTAVVAVLLGTVGFLGAGTAYAHGNGHEKGHEKGHGHGHGKGKGHKHRGEVSKTIVITQSTSCSTTEENTDVQGQSAYGNWSNGKVSPGPQTTNLGSRLGCNNTLVLGK